jgi:hypothetical protein
VERDAITTWLDLAGLALLAVGAGAALLPVIGWAALAVVGLVLLAGARVIDWVAVPDAAPAWWRRMRGGDRK